MFVYITCSMEKKNIVTRSSIEVHAKILFSNNRIKVIQTYTFLHLEMSIILLCEQYKLESLSIKAPEHPITGYKDQCGSDKF